MTPLLALVTTLSNRVRDPNQLGTSFALYAQVLSQCQNITNGALDSQVQNITLPTTPMGKLYKLSIAVPNALRVLGVRDASNRNLDPIPFNMLPAISRTWFRDTGDEFVAWAMAGRDLLILYKALRAASSVNVFYTAILPTMVNPTDISSLSNEQDQLMLDLAECVFLLKGRDYGGIDEALARFLKRTNRERGVERPPISLEKLA